VFVFLGKPDITMVAEPGMLGSLESAGALLAALARRRRVTSARA
jgi:hypothetical protein